ncbi:unnamed protein product [Tenebrio molitor]|nr:unnamed protein product [Tenebrio molitor]
MFWPRRIHYIYRRNNFLLVMVCSVVWRDVFQDVSLSFGVVGVPFVNLRSKRKYWSCIVSYSKR